MKKNGETRYLPRGGCVKKWLLFMRSFLILFLMSTMSLYANRMALAQKVSIKVNNVDLKTVIEASGYDVLDMKTEPYEKKGFSLFHRG